jgi:hypothetical protein
MTKILANAQQFIAQHGRKIDQARFALHFNDGSQQDYLDALAEYQNPDGGFGNALEVDIEAPGSQPFAVELALDYCLKAGIPGDHPLVQKAVSYLEQTQDEDGCWRFTKDIYAHPLAPWFQGWTWPNLNPSCTIAGILREYGLGSPLLHQRVAHLFKQWANLGEFTEGEFYAVRAYALYFLPEGNFSQREFYLSGLLWWLIRRHISNEIADNGHWFEYIRSPHSYVGSRLPEDILNDRLDRLVAEQLKDGGWPTPYNPQWRSPVTINNLLVLKAFGRL